MSALVEGLKMTIGLLKECDSDKIFPLPGAWAPNKKIKQQASDEFTGAHNMLEFPPPPQESFQFYSTDRHMPLVAGNMYCSQVWSHLIVILKHLCYYSDFGMVVLDGDDPIGGEKKPTINKNIF